MLPRMLSHQKTESTRGDALKVSIVEVGFKTLYKEYIYSTDMLSAKEK